MQRGYDAIAPVYDKIARLVYGDALRKAQTCFLPLISPSSAILIAGGGTGWILEEITRIHSQSLYIDYLDISAKMIEKAKRRNIGKNEVHFTNQSALFWQPAIDYDVIITPFFFDNFLEINSQKVFALFHPSLRVNGLWLHTDFQIANKSSHWQKLLLSTMYTFFRMAANIEAKHLPDVSSQFRLHKYKLVEAEDFFHKFIITSVYKKLIPDN